MSALAEMKKLKAAGFTDDELGAWVRDTRIDMAEAGFRQDEIDTYFGQPPFNPKPLVDQFNTAMEQATQPASAEGQPKPVTDFMDALKAGWGEGIVSLLQEPPKAVVAPDAPMASRIAGQIGTMAGDFPAMVAGYLAGGGQVTGTAGAFALPAGMRRVLMEKYQKGEVQNFQDFWERASATFIDTAKGWITGAATGAVGKAVAMTPIASPTAKAAAVGISEIATMVTVGKALDGHIPEPQEFLDAAVTLGFVKGAAKTAGKLREIYAQTGVRPREIVQDVQKDPTIAQDLASADTEIPRAYGGTTARAEEPKLEPDKSMPVGEAQQAILDRIVQHEPETAGLSLRSLYTAALDNLHPIWYSLKDVGKEKLPTAENPYSLERLTRGTMGKGIEFLKHGAFKFDTYETVTKGFLQMLEPVKKDLDGFRAYIVSKRVIEKEAQGISTGFNLEHAKTVVREGASKYQAIHEQRLQFIDARLQYLLDSGMIAKDKAKAIREANKDYVGFYRFFEEDEAGRPSSSRKLRDPIHKMKGGEQKILDPIMSDIKDTFLFIGLAERNAARQAYVKHPELAKKQPSAIRPIELTDKELERLGTSEEVATIFRAFRQPLAKDELDVFEQGQRQVYKVDPAVAEAFQDLDRISTNIVTEMLLHTPANLLRAGVIVTPEYISRNIIRDAVSAFVYAGSNPIKTIKGGISITKKDTAYQNWLKGGGANATMVAIDRDYVQSHIMDLNLETSAFQRAWNVARTPIDVLRAASEFVENSTRLGAVRSEMQKAKDKATIQALSLIARESTVDFARHGKNLQEFGKMTAFFNPTLQGIDRFARAMQDNPMATTAKALSSITLPALLLWWANKDDKEIQNLPRWQRDTMLITRVPLPDGGSFLLRIPLAHELGVLFATLPTRLLDAYVKDNPEAMRDFDRTLLTAFTPSIIPTLAVPMLQQFTNVQMFSGGPLIPAHAERLLPEYQYTPYTTELTKAIGGFIGAFPGMEDASLRHDPFLGGTARALTSPILIENYVRSWTGGMGMYLLQLADKGLREAKVLPDPVKPAWTLADIPIIRAFTARYPSASAQSIQDFYDDEAIARVKFNTAMELAKSGDPRAVSFIGQHKADMVKLDGFVTALNLQSRLIRMLDKNPNQTPDEKRQIIDTLYYRMIEISRAGNQTLRTINVTVRAMEKQQAASQQSAPAQPRQAPSLSAPMQQAPNQAAPPSIGP